MTDPFRVELGPPQRLPDGLTDPAFLTNESPSEDLPSYNHVTLTPSVGVRSQDGRKTVVAAPVYSVGGANAPAAQQTDADAAADAIRQAEAFERQLAAEAKNNQPNYLLYAAIAVGAYLLLNR